MHTSKNSSDNVVEVENEDNINISEFTKDGLKLIVNATKAAGQLPSGSSRDLYSAYPSFVRVVKSQSDKILEIISDVLKSQNIKGNIARRDNDEKMEMLLECNDIMLEQINSNLDEILGIKKVPETVLVESEFKPLPQSADRNRLSGSWNANKNIASLQKSAKLLTAKNILRPQINFKTAVDNRNLPFEPRIKIKPNSIKPLAVLAEYDDDGNVESFLHPYEFELNKFEAPAHQLVKAEVQKFDKMEETEFKFITTESELKAMLEELRSTKELAIDLEHHSYRTFQGITCLMQLSTRTKDYIVDTIELRDEIYILNEIFTDPKIVKVFHGADSDVEWLQRDLSLYVVNMFDTHQAAKRLNFARLSLAYLLKHYCNIEADKTFQLADWRIRPLPEELVYYARQDTHYLLYIYDLMRNELIKQRNGEPILLQSVYQASTEICKKRYIKPLLLDDSHLDLYHKSKRLFDNRQLFALKELFKWRDEIARLEDESCGYVLPNHMLMHISEILPRELQGILACCNPVPPLVRQSLHQLHQIILKARDQPLITKIVPDSAQRSTINQAVSVNQFLYCPHDLTHAEDFRDNLPTLLGNKNSVLLSFNPEIMINRCLLEIFNCPEIAENERDRNKPSKLRDVKFITPYSRYLSILPLAEEQERLENLKEEEKAKSRQLCPERLGTSVPKTDSNKRISDETTETVDQPPAKKIKTEIGNPSFREILEQEKKKQPPPKTPNLTKKQKKMLNRQNKLNKIHPEADSEQKSTPQQNVMNFDYSQVDYSKFQGGSKKQQYQNQGRKKNQFDSTFKGRGQKSKNADKKFNKMFSFSKLNNRK